MGEEEIPVGSSQLAGIPMIGELPSKRKRSRRHGMLACPNCGKTLRSIMCAKEPGGNMVIRNHVGCTVCQKVYLVKYEDVSVIVRKK